MWIQHMQVMVFEDGHAPGTVLGAGDLGVTETVFIPVGPTTLGRGDRAGQWEGLPL